MPSFANLTSSKLVSLSTYLVFSSFDISCCEFPFKLLLAHFDLLIRPHNLTAIPSRFCESPAQCRSLASPFFSDMPSSAKSPLSVKVRRHELFASLATPFSHWPSPVIRPSTSLRPQKSAQSSSVGHSCLVNHGASASALLSRYPFGASSGFKARNSGHRGRSSPLAAAVRRALRKACQMSPQPAR